MDYPQDINQESWNALREAVQNKDIRQIQILSEKIGNEIEHLNNEYNSLSDIIPDIDQWKHQFNIDELKQVHSAVENKLAQWSNLSLEEQKKKLDFEANTFLGSNMHGVQQKYPTWQVSQSAYLNQLKNVNYKIDIQNIENQLSMIDAEYLSAHPKTKKLAKLWGDTQLAIHNNEDIDTIKDKFQLTLDEYYKKVNKHRNPFTEDAYSQERKDKALYGKNLTLEQVDIQLRNTTKNVWSNATNDEKIAVTAYTNGSGHMNRPLRGYDGSWYNFKGVGKVDLDNELGKQHIIDATNLISRSLLTRDVWLSRGWDNIAGTEAFLGSKYSDIMAMTQKQLNDNFLGKVIKDEGFISCGTKPGTGFNGYLMANIYCPRGTQALYAEPFSVFNGDSLTTSKLWDGETKYTLRTEFETIIQRGSTFRLTKIYKEKSRIYIDLDVISQIELK